MPKIATESTRIDQASFLGTRTTSGTSPQTEHRQRDPGAFKGCLIIATLSLSGCQLAQYAPSLKYCETVTYERHGRNIHIEADCFEAVESAVPIAVVKP